ncbi:MAG: hypothetical protein U0271_45285 [Polyangiaceae bacterium]
MARARRLLLVDDDKGLSASPSRAERELEKRLGEERLRQIDCALVRFSQARALKIARVVSDAAEHFDFGRMDDTAARLFTRRLIRLGEQGFLEIFGNARRPTFSEVQRTSRSADLLADTGSLFLAEQGPGDPGRSMDFKARLREVSKRSKLEDPRTLAYADALVTDFPGEASAWAKRSFIKELGKDLVGAEEDVTMALRLAPDNPGHCLDRAMLRGRLHDHEGAIADYSAGLAACNERELEFFGEALLFGRAHQLVLLGKHAEALLDLAGTGDRAGTMFGVSKAELMAECARALPSFPPRL